MALLDQHVRVVLLAGGQGERLWPKSTRGFPKQFLRVDGGKSLLRQTFERASLLVDSSAIYVVTGEEYADLTCHELPELSRQNLILEPVGRNTAAAIALAALWLERAGGNVTILALPSDHAISGTAEFQSAMAAATLAARDGDLVTVGIRPTRPATGYGYIRVEPSEWVRGHVPVLPVTGFVEKPDPVIATRFFQSGRYLWNAGILTVQVQALWRELSRHIPETFELMREVRATAMSDDDLRGHVAARYGDLQSVSFDYGLLERSDRVVVAPASFEWTDVGDWNALGLMRPRDEQGNSVRGAGFLHATTGTIVESDAERLVAVVGAADLIVVDTPSAVLVCDRARVQEIRQIAGPASALAEAVERMRGPEGKVVEKPWGREIWWAVTEHYAAKQIEVKPGHALSLQYHERKHETMYVLGGTARLRIGEDWHDLRPGKVFTIEPGTVHRLEAVSAVTLIEVSTPELDDVVRLEDRYGRVEES